MVIDNNLAYPVVVKIEEHIAVPSNITRR